MSRNAFSKSQVFLMEFILVVLFFALCGATCIKAFVKADALSRDSRELNQGMVLLQSAVECVKASTASQEELSNLPDLLNSTLNMERQDGERYHGYYDSDFKACAKAEAAYYLVLSLTYVESDILQAEAKVMKLDMEPICSLTADQYVPFHGKAGGENG